MPTRKVVRVICAVVDALNAQLMEVSYETKSKHLDAAYRAIKTCKSALVDYLEETE